MGEFFTDVIVTTMIWFNKIEVKICLICEGCDEINIFYEVLVYIINMDICFCFDLT